MYKSTRKFSKDQLIFVVQVMLEAALDRIQNGLPDSISWKERMELVEGGDPMSLCGWERGALETGGMGLAVLYAQLTNDGLGIGDALSSAGDFEGACQKLVNGSWKNQGAEIRKIFAKNRDAEVKKSIPQLYGDLWPDTLKHAEAFVALFEGEYKFA